MKIYHPDWGMLSLDNAVDTKRLSGRELLMVLSTIIPCAAGYAVISLHRQDGAYVCDTRPIIAWACHTAIHPVTVDGLEMHYDLILDPCGTVWKGIEGWDSLELYLKRFSN